jgi:hypothetical protein
MYNQEYTASVFKDRIRNIVPVFRVVRNILPLSSGNNQEYTSSVFGVESGIYCLCFQG